MQCARIALERSAVALVLLVFIKIKGIKKLKLLPYNPLVKSKFIERQRI